ncbi:MAG TPA: dTMP kinase [Methanocorpusculum sp.]|nr:dTMP kinase [Methanocorpusculum sp.]HJJ54273.1 dTMP kinase [Methanocorpusculum sp.]HKL97516.1 dTMP kinase [Methanocorpusculum sp.]
MLITLEGIDGSGKSTLFKGLQERLSDLDPLFTREPGSPYLGDAVREVIHNRGDPLVEAALFVADHAVHLATVVRPALEEGRLVISDRYSDSRFAYQQNSLKNVHPDPKAWLTAVHKDWSIRPDLTILLLLAPEVAVSRLSGREVKDHFEKVENLEEVQKCYIARMNEDPERFLLIDAAQDPEKILDFAEKSIRVFSTK